jgi:hypothetical protein
MAKRSTKETDFNPPPAIDIARRALILSGVVCRASLETHRDKAYGRETVNAVHEWFDYLELWPHLEPFEKRVIRASFGSIPKRVRFQGTWYVEGVAIFAWALKHTEFPRHDQKVDPIAVTNALGFLDKRARELLTNPTLRTIAELEAAREWLYDVHCTLRGFLHHGGDGRLAPWIDKYSRASDVPRKRFRIRGRLALDGNPIESADRDRVQECETIICERHRAAIWLEGHYPLYTELPVDT